MSATPEDEIKDLVGLATFGEGVLSEKDEHRIVKVALARGLGPAATRGAIDAALAAAGARRPEKKARPAGQAPSSATDPALEKSGSETSDASDVPKPDKPDDRVEPGSDVSDRAIRKVISRRFDREAELKTAAELKAAETQAAETQTAETQTAETRAAETRAADSEVIVAELVSAPAPAPARAADSEVIVAEMVVAAPLPEIPAPSVCAGCLAVVPATDMASGRATRLADGRVHCRACLSRLESGLICAKCFLKIERVQLTDGRARAIGERAFHITCLPQSSTPTATPAPIALTPASSRPRTSIEIEPTSPILGQRPSARLGTKCGGCYVMLTSRDFETGRAKRIEGIAYCIACAQRTSKGLG